MTYPEQPGQPAPQSGQPSYPAPPAPSAAPEQPSAYPPPAQGGYPPAQGSYPPAQGGYAPAQPGYAPGQAPGYPAAPAYPAPTPGRGLSIAGLILAFLLPLIGFILSLVARSKLKKANAPTGIATAGIIIGAVLTVLAIIGMIVGGIAIANVLSMCAQLGSGTWQVDGVTYTCG